MCMKNLNATILTCVDATKNSTNSGALTYNSVFDIIKPTEVGGKLYLSEFDIIVDLCAVFDENNEDKYILKNQIYDCRLTVTFDGIDFKGICDFLFNTELSKLSKCGERLFCNATLFAKNQSFVIPENATYCDLVLLIKHPPQSETGKWVLQTIKRIYINK